MSSLLPLPVRKLHPAAKLPAYAHGPDEDSGLDLCAVEAVTLPAGKWAAVPTGIAVEIPSGYEGQVRPRSGLAARHGIALLNAPGTIDPGYRGEIKVLLINHSEEDFRIEAGDRIAQLVIAAYARVACRWEEALSESERGEGGFGSTGRQGLKQGAG
ncbi:MAG: dUTP diphosphatase [Bryobacterales bacterium]